MSSIDSVSTIDRTRSTLLYEKAEKTGMVIDKDRADTVFCLETSLHQAHKLNSPKTVKVFENIIADTVKNSEAAETERQHEEMLAKHGFSGRELSEQLLGNGSTIEVYSFDNKGRRTRYIRTWIEHPDHETTTDEDLAGFLDTLVKILREDPSLKPRDLTHEEF